MLLHMLSPEAQKTFLEIAWIFCIADNELLWDGKTQEEITGDTDLSDISIQILEAEEAIMSSFKNECKSASSYVESEVKEEFIGKIRKLRISLQNDPGERFNAAKALLQERIDSGAGDGWSFSTAKSSNRLNPVSVWNFSGTKNESKTLQTATTSKVMLFEIMLLCLADGNISGIEKQLLQEFRQLIHIEDFVFDDLLECAQNMNRETLKTIAIILE